MRNIGKINRSKNSDQKDIRTKIVSHNMDAKLSNHIVGMKNTNLENRSSGKTPKNGNQSELPQDYTKLTQEQLIELLRSRDQQLAAVKQKPNEGKTENDRKMANTNRKKTEKVDPLKQTIEQIRKQIADQVEVDEKQEAAFRVQEQKMEKSKTGRDIVYYPKIAVSLDAFRRDEAAKVNNFKQGSSFADLFKNRIDQMPGDRVLLSVQPFVTIETGLQEEDRSFGPFDIEIPELDGKEEMYKVFMFVLLSNNFNLQSGQMISKLGAKVMTYNKQFLMDHYMMGVKLESHLLSKYGKIKSTGKYSCAPDYLWDQCKGKRGFKSYSRDKFTAELMPYASECVSGFRDMQFSTRNIIQWAKECHPNVSIHAFDARYQKFVAHIAPTSRDITLVFIVKDHHLFPITDEQLKTLASKANQGGAKNLLKYMAEVKWRRRNENVQKLKKMKHVVKHDKKDSIMILPEEVAMQEAAKLYCDKSNFYIEYLHWSNNGILDGFVDERNNMYLLNEDYDKRKTVCEAMFEKFKTDAFIWANQSFTQLATSIFRQIGGKIPESCYNDKTRRILDDFSPRALQQCTTDDFPTDVVNFDICKCYPSVLLNNEYKIPVYDIHDVIVPFGGEDELDKIGEFYIDESVVEIHGNEIKIEAAF